MSPGNVSGKDDEQERIDKDYAQYLDDRKMLTESEYEAGRSLDQALLTLSGALLAFSITFVEKLAANQPRSTPILGLAWLCLIGSMLATLLSFRSSRKAFRIERERRDELVGKEGEELNAIMRKKNKPADRTEQMNELAIALFICGAFLLGVFAFLNLP